MTRRLATFWSFDADWELLEPAEASAPGPRYGRNEYRDRLERLCAAQRGNRVEIRGLAERRYAGLVPSDSDREIIATLSALLARGLLRLDERPRRLSGSWAQRPTIFDEPSVPLRQLEVDPKDRPYETGFVAFILLDEAGVPLLAQHDCQIDTERREGRYGGAVVDYRPIRRSAHVSLVMSDVRWPSEHAAAGQNPGLGSTPSGAASASAAEESTAEIRRAYPSSLDDAAGRPNSFCMFQIIDEYGAPFAGAEISIARAGGEVECITLDAGGGYRRDDLAEDARLQIRIPADLVTPTRHAQPAAPPDVACVPGDRAVPRGTETTCTLATGRAHRIVVMRRRLDFEDVTFGNERAVFLPEPPIDHRIGTAGSSNRGLGMLASVLAFAAANPDHRLWITGHADALGSGASDRSLSQARADNIALLLRGELDDWASHTMGVYAVEDLQHALAWVARSFAWDCDPGPPDNELGDRTLAALTRFRARAAVEHATEPVAADSAVCAADWRRIASLYQLAVASVLDREPSSIGRALRLHGDPRGCGVDRPRRACAGATTDGTDRRTELVFLPPVVANALAPEQTAGRIDAGDAFEVRYLSAIGVAGGPTSELVPVPAFVLPDRMLRLPNPCVRLELPAVLEADCIVTFDGIAIAPTALVVHDATVYFEVPPPRREVLGQVTGRTAAGTVRYTFRVQACETMDAALASLGDQFRNMTRMVAEGIVRAATDQGTAALLRRSARNREVAVLCALENAALSTSDFQRFAGWRSDLELTPCHDEAH